MEFMIGLNRVFSGLSQCLRLLRNDSRGRPIHINLNAASVGLELASIKALLKGNGKRLLHSVLIVVSLKVV